MRLRKMPLRHPDTGPWELRQFIRPDHGGRIWEASQELGVPVNELFDFSSNINPLGCSPLAKIAVEGALNLAASYPDNDCTQLKKAVASYIGRIGPSNIFIGNGVTEIIHLFARAFIKRGAQAIIVQPTFSEYEYGIDIQGARPKHVLRGECFELDLDLLRRGVSRSTAAIFLCNPNNPTSTVDDRGIIERVVYAARRSAAMVLLDESFMEFVDDPVRFSLATAAKDFRNLLVLRSLTKPFGLAGLRVGYAIGHESTIRRLEDIKVTWAVNTLAQIAAIAALKDKDFLRRSRKLISTERVFLERELQELGLQVTPPRANFLLARLPSHLDARDLKRRFMNRGILIRECSQFRGLGSNFIRLAVKTRRENLVLLRAIREQLFSA